MKEILEKNYSRKMFFKSVVIISVLLIFSRYFALPYFYPEEVKTGLAVFLSTFLDGLLVSLIITVVIGAFLFWIKPEEMKNATIDIAEPRELPELFETAFPISDIWYYKGGCGRYFRTKTLPEMALWARKKSISREIRAVVLNPLDMRLCEKHATYRKSTASVAKESGRWNNFKVRTELCATIFSTLVYQVEEPMLRINLSLSSSYSVFRIDLSNDYAIITKEDRSSPAIICHSGTHFYRSYKDEVLMASNQGINVKKLNRSELNMDAVTGALVKDVLCEVELVDSNMDDEFFSEVARILNENKNPYA
ncbi:hypothetical protein AB4356_13720 [Vibrio lentus]